LSKLLFDQIITLNTKDLIFNTNLKLTKRKMKKHKKYEIDYSTCFKANFKSRPTNRHLGLAIARTESSKIYPVNSQTLVWPLGVIFILKK
jgi:hypothetical protein